MQPALTALLIVDHAGVRRYRARYLEGKGIDVVEAGGRDGALDALAARDDIDIVLFGPLHDAAEDASPALLSDIQEASTLPVIATFGSGRADFPAFVLGTGIADLVRENAHLDELVARIHLRAPLEQSYEFSDDENDPSLGTWRIDTISRSLRDPGGRSFTVGVPRGAPRGTSFGLPHFNLLLDLLRSSPGALPPAAMPANVSNLINEIREIVGKDKIASTRQPDGPMYALNRTAAARGRQRHLKARGTERTEARQLKVLLAEDDREQRETLGHALLQEVLENTRDAKAFDVTAVATGSDALARLPGGFDVILLDLHMPDTVHNPYEIIGKVTDASSAPIIVLSGYELDRTPQVVLRPGVSDFMRKPIDISELFMRIRMRTHRPAAFEFRDDDARGDKGNWRVDTAARTLTAPAGEPVHGLGARDAFNVLVRLLTSVDGTMRIHEFPSRQKEGAANNIGYLRSVIGHDKIATEAIRTAAGEETVYRFCRQVTTFG